MRKWIDKLELKDDDLNVRVMKGIAEAYGKNRANQSVRKDISADLSAAGWRHIPEKLPTIWTVDRFGIPIPVLIYRRDSVADRLISATLKPEMGTVELVKRAVKLIARDE